EADEYLALATEHGLGFQALGGIYRGWALAALRHADEGMAALGTGSAGCDKNGFMLWRPWFLTLFSDACRIAGQLPAALGHLTGAQRLTEEGGERGAATEALGRRGGVLLATGDPAGAEARDLLAPVYGWFTDGFATPVFKEARALLDELH